MAEPAFSLTKQVFLLYSSQTSLPLGTCFRIGDSGSYVTATHVIRDIRRESIEIISVGGERRSTPVESIVSHSSADVALMRTPSNDDIMQAEGFTLGVPPNGFEEFPLGEDVFSYGFPWFANEQRVVPRMMKGHIQGQYEFASAPYRYKAFELAFPAFPGMSGSPVFADWNRKEVVGVVTEGVRYSSHLGDDRVEAHWTVAASLRPLANWVESA